MSTTGLNVMTPAHPLWGTFKDRLEGPEGCDFQKDRPDHPGISWKCKGGHNQDFAKAILSTLPDIDVDASLAYFAEHGGHCDCEILFNVEDLT